LNVPRGTTAIEAVMRSSIPEAFPEISMGELIIGIFGEVVPLATVLSAADRVEIYRPLVINPKDARRARARKRRGQ